MRLRLSKKASRVCGSWPYTRQRAWNSRWSFSLTRLATPRETHQADTSTRPTAYRPCHARTSGSAKGGCKRQEGGNPSRNASLAHVGRRRPGRGRCRPRLHGGQGRICWLDRGRLQNRSRVRDLVGPLQSAGDRVLRRYTSGNRAAFKGDPADYLTGRWSQASNYRDPSAAGLSFSLTRIDQVSGIHRPRGLRETIRRPHIILSKSRLSIFLKTIAVC
jgi:hypothetical protein